MKPRWTSFLAGALALAILMSCAMLPAALAEAADPYGKYDPGITLTAALNSLDPTVQLTDENTDTDNMWTRLFEEKIGITLDYLWTAEPKQGREKLNLAISSNDIPDVFRCEPVEFEQMKRAGLLADLTDAYDQYAGAFMKDVMTRPGSGDAMKRSSQDGKLYAVPYFLNCTDDTKVVWVRKDWLDKLGLPVPTTYQEVIDCARAFMKADFDGNGIDDTLGLGFDTDSTSIQNMGGRATFFNCFGAYMDIWIEGPDGKLMYGMQDKEPWKAAFTELNKLYNEGIIDKNYASLNWDADVLPKIMDGKLGVVFEGMWHGWWPLGEMKNVDPDCEWISIPVPSATDAPGKSQSQTVIVNGFNVVSKDCENPEALIKMLNAVNDYMWNSDEQTFFEYGYDAAGNNPWLLTPVYFEFPGKNHQLYQKTVTALETGDATDLNGEETLIYNWMVDYRDKGDLSRWGIWLSYGPDSSCAKIDTYLEHDLYALNKFYGNPPPAMLDNKAMLDKLFTDYFVKLVNGEYPIEKYDEYCEQWLAQGGAEITEQVNAEMANYAS